ncbi:ABC transporter I family member 1, putative [Plasmodium berghei]|uniref:ABC transporter I family member 1, putative n=2 Tax=Plasmodium berghei TaxID=5821 RepID=A0A509ANG1_PLABA|nr:ABC transporter I family member 1, putative [Plasmodium berghei ANKA]CXI77013.1 ABC transporter I family member 1, putative [Plasmodium berghei]SCM24994.1 ABC transporter I family member 1, putative [Plasmodium berghei]SCN27230.1 ABC transporter I family member 1, putative [Plasmodium berghei]SCO61811.1 ABC transporter I family member 1, putative [Plasmodium berghei]SCO63655.1 ABC transporter I family member 1, putative [Plasmodium berghei]|eukprot:XP_034422866.1 ABC transporter I family member 1, putative [Plasmodium berghei ANKA]
MKTRKLYGLIKKTYYEKKKNPILYFFFLLIPFSLILFHLFLRNLSEKYSFELANLFSENDKIDLNDTIRQYVLFMSNDLCSMEINDTIYVNHICLTPSSQIINDFLKYANGNDMNIFRIYNSEEECEQNFKYAIFLNENDVKGLGKNPEKNNTKLSYQSIEFNNQILNNYKSKIKDSYQNDNNELTIDDLYKNIYSDKEYEKLLKLKIDHHTLNMIKKTKLYKKFIKDIRSIKNESQYKEFVNDKKNILFFYNFVKNDVIETNYSCGLLGIENLKYESKENDKKRKPKILFSNFIGKYLNKLSDHKKINHIKQSKEHYSGNAQNITNLSITSKLNSTNYKHGNNFRLYKHNNGNIKNVKNDNNVSIVHENLNFRNDGPISNISYKIRVGDYALLNSNEKIFFNDININLKQNFINFNTVDDLSFNIYFNEWYYNSFFIALEYHFNYFLLKYNMFKNNKNEEFRNYIGKINNKNIVYSHEEANDDVKYVTNFSLENFYSYKMPMKIFKINAFDALEKNIFRIVIFLCICLFIINICFDINKERKINMENFLFCIKVNKYYYYFSWLLFYFIVLFFYNIIFTYIIYLYIFKKLINYFILFYYIYMFIMNSLLVTVICVHFSYNSAINYIASFLLFFLFSTFRLIIHSGANKLLISLVLLIPHSSFCLALDFIFILIKNDIKIMFNEMYITIEDICLMDLVIYPFVSFIILVSILTFIIYIKSKDTINFSFKIIPLMKKTNIYRKDYNTAIIEDNKTENKNIHDHIYNLEFDSGHTNTKNKYINKKRKFIKTAYNNDDEAIANNKCCLFIKNVNKFYGKKQALKNISLTLKSNRIFVLLGENGSGKSTLINIITKMINKDSGEIYFVKNNFKLRKMKAEKNKHENAVGIDTVSYISQQNIQKNNKYKKKTNEMKDLTDNISLNINTIETNYKLSNLENANKIKNRNKKELEISFCSQNVILYDNLTFYETIRTFLLYYNKDVNKYLKKKRTLSMLNGLDLSKYLNDKIKNLIDEIKKKISIFICFLVKRDIYILDEPFIALDIKTKTKLFKFFDKIKKNNIILICTHDIYEANKFADDIAVIKSGEIIFNGGKPYFQNIINYKFILNVRFNCFSYNNNDKHDHISTNEKNLISSISKEINKNNENFKPLLIHEDNVLFDKKNKKLKDKSKNTIFDIINGDIKNDENSIESIKNSFIKYIKSSREYNKNCYIFFNRNYIYCTYKINELDKLKNVITILNKLKNVLHYELKTIDIYYTYIYIYTYNEKIKLLKNIQDKDVKKLIKMDPLFYMFYYNTQCFNNIKNQLIMESKKKGNKTITDFGYINDMIQGTITENNTTNVKNDFNKETNIHFRNVDKLNKSSDSQLEKEEYTEYNKYYNKNKNYNTYKENSVKSGANKLNLENSGKYNNYDNSNSYEIIKKLQNFFSVYITPSLFLKLKKDLSEINFYWYKFLVPLLLLSCGLLIIKCVSLFGKVQYIKLDNSTISSSHLKESIINYGIIYKLKINDSEEYIYNIPEIDKYEHKKKMLIGPFKKYFNLYKENRNNNYVKSKSISYDNPSDIINNNMGKNLFDYYNNTIFTLFKKYSLKENINYINAYIDEENLYDNISDYLELRSKVNDDLSLGSYVFIINETQTIDVNNNVHSNIEMDINLFHNYISIHSYPYYTNLVFNVLYDFQNIVNNRNSQQEKDFNDIEINNNIHGVGQNGKNNKNIYNEQMNTKRTDIKNEPFRIKYHEYFIRDFYINMYVFLSLIIFFCVFFERLKNEIENRKIFTNFNVNKYIHYFQIIILDYFYFILYIIFLFIVLYIFECTEFLYPSFFFFLMIFGFNTFLSICLFSSLYLNSYIIFLFVNFILCGIISIGIYVIVLLSYAYNNIFLIKLSHIFVCIFRILDSFCLSHALNIRSLCLNLKRDLKAIDNDTIINTHVNTSHWNANKYNQSANFFQKNFQNNIFGGSFNDITQTIPDTCSNENSFFNERWDFVFMFINFSIYFLILFYKLYRLRYFQKKKKIANQKLQSTFEGKYAFLLNNFNLLNKKYKNKKSINEKKLNDHTTELNTLEDKHNKHSKFFTDFSRNDKEEKTHKEKIYATSKYENPEILENKNSQEKLEKKNNLLKENLKKRKNYLQLTEIENIDKKSLQNNVKYILKNINIKIKPYNIYTFSSVYNNDLNVLYLFKYFFLNNMNNSYVYENGTENNRGCFISKMFTSKNRKKKLFDIFSEKAQKKSENECKLLLMPNMTIYEHFNLIFKYKKLNLTDIELLYIIYTLMLLVNLKCDVHIKCNQLSGGMKKKVILMINLLRNDDIILLYKLNDNIDFCSQIYINIILKNILEMNSILNYITNDDIASSMDYSVIDMNQKKTKINKNGKRGITNHTKEIGNYYISRKTNSSDNNVNKKNEGANSVIQTGSDQNLECSISSNVNSINHNIINSFIKENILKLQFSATNYIIYTHIYTDMLYYDYLYLFNKNQIAYKNNVKNIINNFEKYYLFQIKLKGIYTTKIYEYIEAFFLENNNAFNKFIKVVNTFNKKKNINYNHIEPHSILKFLEKYANKAMLSFNKLRYIFKTKKRKRGQINDQKHVYHNDINTPSDKNKTLIKYSKLYKTLIKLIDNNFSYVHVYLNGNKYISVFELFKFALCRIAYKDMRKFFMKYKNIKILSSEIIKSDQYNFVIKILENAQAFKLLEINAKLKFTDNEFQVSHVNIDNLSANDIFLLILKT